MVQEALLKLRKASLTCFVLVLLIFARVAVEDELQTVSFLGILGEAIVNAFHTADCLLSLLMLVLMLMLMLLLFLWEAHLKHSVAGLGVFVVKAMVHVLGATILLFLVLRVVLWRIVVGRVTA